MPAMSLAAAIPQDDFTLIVGGSPAASGEFPYIVSLQNSRGSHFCGGSLLNANTVITAGHCAEGQTASALRVRAGTLVSYFRSLLSFSLLQYDRAGERLSHISSFDETNPRLADKRRLCWVSLISLPHPQTEPRNVLETKTRKEKLSERLEADYSVDFLFWRHASWCF